MPLKLITLLVALYRSISVKLCTKPLSGFCTVPNNEGTFNVILPIQMRTDLSDKQTEIFKKFGRLVSKIATKSNRSICCHGSRWLKNLFYRLCFIDYM